MRAVLQQQEVGFVQHRDPRLVGEAEARAASPRPSRLCCCGVRVRDVDDVQQQRRVVSSSSVARNAATSCVGSFWMKPTVSVSSAGCACVEVDAARQRVERGEELVLHEHVGVARQRAHQRALAGVRVADERDDRHALALAPAAVERALLAHVLDLLLELRDLVADEAAVRLDLRLTGAAHADGARCAAAPPGARGATTGPCSRGSRYSVCASSTCRRPSRVRARCAKMSRISAVRSSTFTSSAFSRLRCCDGDSSSSKMTIV